MAQVITGIYKTHHPLLHTLFLGFCYTLGGRMGSYTLGIALYTISQMLVVSGSFSYCIVFLYKRGLGKKMRLLIGLFYGLFPVFSMLTVSTTKDVFFGAIFLIFMIQLFSIIENNKTPVFAIICGIILVLLRNNAIYAIAIAIPVLIICNRKYWKRWSIILMSILFCSIIVNNSLIRLTHASDGNLAEALSVPLQQIARVANYYENHLSVEEKEEIYYFIPENAIKEYNGYISDGIKGSADASKIRYETGRFLKLWFELGTKEPLAYIDSFLTNTMGYWFLQDVVHSEIYGSGGFLLTNHHELGKYYEVEKKCLCPLSYNYLQGLFGQNQYRNSPFLSFLLKPALFFFFDIFYITEMLYRKKYQTAMPMIMIGAYYLTLFLGPVALIRYLFGIIACCPLLFGISYLSSSDIQACPTI
ncbi:MAG: DUF6020 family protein [Lachnospiraceae bacterium]